MAFFSQSFSNISQPKMRQEGFHLPSPSPSTGNPPSPTSAGPFDLFLSQSTHHTQHGGSGDNRFPSLALPDAFSRTSAIDLTDELAMSLMSPATSNERSTHTPPFERQHHGQNQSHTHNIFDISAPPNAANFAHHHNAHHQAFSLPHTSARADLPPLSQPASLATHGLHGPGAAFDAAHGGGFGGLGAGGREPFPAHFNSTIPPLSAHHDGGSATAHASLTNHFAPFSPGSSAPLRDSPSPADTANGGGGRNGSRPPTAASARSPSRSRSRVRTNSTSQSNGVNGGVPVPPSSGGGPTRTAKSASRRRDSFTTMAPHLAHSHSHSLSHHHAHGHLHTLPSPPLGSAPRPQSIVIPPHSAGGMGGGALSPLGGMGVLGSALSPLGVGQTSGWFLPGGAGAGGSVGVGVGSGAQGTGGEFSLPTPESIHGAFGTFGSSVGSMGISPKDTTLGGPGMKDDSSPIDTVSKQAAIVSEKRRKRRESHNAVERRRRDNINEKISELATLIPEVLLDPGAPTSGGNAHNSEDGLPGRDASEEIGESSSNAPPPSSSGSGSAGKEPKENNGGVKANKGMILRKSVEYIRYLQQLVNAQAARNRTLEAQLMQAGLSTGAGSGPGSELDALRGLSQQGGIGGVNGFKLGAFGGFLEPMAEGDAEMEMDLEMDGMEMDHSHLGSHALNHFNHDQYAVNRTGAGTKRARGGASPGASVSDEHSAPEHEHEHEHDAQSAHSTHEDQDDDADADGRSSGSGSGSEPATSASVMERGRRGRDVRVNRLRGGGAGVSAGEDGLVAVKEEA